MKVMQIRSLFFVKSAEKEEEKQETKEMAIDIILYCFYEFR